MARYWPFSFLRFFSSRSVKGKRERARLMMSHLDGISLIFKGFIIWPKKNFPCGTQQAINLDLTPEKIGNIRQNRLDGITAINFEKSQSTLQETFSPPLLSWLLKLPISRGLFKPLNLLGPKSDQHQFSPNNISR